MPPAAAIAADRLASGLFRKWGSFVLGFGTVVLLYSLGPRDLGDEAQAFVAEARDQGDDEHASALAQAFCLSEIRTPSRVALSPSHAPWSYWHQAV